MTAAGVRVMVGTLGIALMGCCGQAMLICHVMLHLKTASLNGHALCRATLPGHAHIPCGLASQSSKLVGPCTLQQTLL